MKLIIFDSVKDLQAYCAKRFIAWVRDKPNAVVGFATGVSPVDAYKLIIEDYKLNKTDWSKVTTFNLDEFVGIDPSHREAFIKQMKTNLFDHINVQPYNIHIPNSLAIDPNEEAHRYECLIENHPIDFQYISLGVNGHMAYNEPGTPFESYTHVATLTEATIKDMVAKGKFKDINESPKYAISMGVQTLLKYTRDMMMVSYGPSKAEVTRAMLEDQPNSEVTASYLQLHPNCEFVLDREAASKLSPQTLAKAERV